MSDVIGAAIQLRKELLSARAVAKTAMQALYEEMTREAEEVLDEAVRAAHEAGVSRSELAKSLGESRVTINARLTRAYGGTVPDKVTRRAEPEPKKVPYYLNQPDGSITYLAVDYDDYGPDHLTGGATFEVIHDEDNEGSYWFLHVSEFGTSNDAVVHALDTQFSGWYYDDAHAFTVRAMQEGNK